jgi:hypothetical protein
METDRELLERAAEAAGMDALWGGPHGMQERRVPKGEYAWVWNPLVSDGDALRLSVQTGEPFVVRARCVTTMGGLKEDFDPGVPGDDMRAVRRIITRAAASLATKE